MQGFGGRSRDRERTPAIVVRNDSDEWNLVLHCCFDLHEARRHPTVSAYYKGRCALVDVLYVGSEGHWRCSPNPHGNFRAHGAELIVRDDFLSRAIGAQPLAHVTADGVAAIAGD